MSEGEKRKPLTLMLSPSEIEEIDDVQFTTRQRSRAQAIRFLIKKGLEAVAHERAGS